MLTARGRRVVNGVKIAVTFLCLAGLMATTIVVLAAWFRPRG